MTIAYRNPRKRATGCHDRRDTQKIWPHPAPRCGHMDIHCEDCGLRAIITVAGRRDDPRSVILACKGKAA